MLKESKLNTPSTQANTPTTVAAVTRFMPFSVSQATAGSPMEIDEVKPANSTNTKNKAPNTSTTEIPPSSSGIDAKACGKVTNSKPGQIGRASCSDSVAITGCEYVRQDHTC